MRRHRQAPSGSRAYLKRQVRSLSRAPILAIMEQHYANGRRHPYGSFHEQFSADWEAAQQYALTRPEEELPSELTYHNLWHTRDDVLPAVRRLAAMAGIGEHEAHLLEIAASYHDIGFTVQRQEHVRGLIVLEHDVGRPERIYPARGRRRTSTSTSPGERRT